MPESQKMKVSLDARTDVVVEQTKTHEVVIRIECRTSEKASEVYTTVTDCIRQGSLVLTGIVAKESPDAAH